LRIKGGSVRIDISSRIASSVPISFLAIPTLPASSASHLMLRRRIWKNLLLAAAGLGLVVAFVHYFVAELGRDESPDLAAVVAAPPPGFEIVELGGMAPARAARELASLLAARPRKIGVRFTTPRATLYWLADPAADSLEERSAGAAGTRLATLWTGQIRRRLDWAAAHDGDLSPPGLSPPERTNLYH
jgi:hypothetical protein